MMVPFQIAGNTGEHKSTQFSSELTRNMYLSYSESNNRWGCHDFPGLKLVATGAGADRGDHVMAGVRYVINGTNLYSEDIAGTRTSIGTVSGTGRAVFADDGTNLYFVANNTIYKYNGSTLSTVSQSVITNPAWIDYINRQFVIGGDGGMFAVSDAGDGDTYNALNDAEAETRPDGLVRGYVFNQVVYMLGEKTTETWYNSGIGNPPFDRQDTGLVNVGIIGKHAVANTDRYLYWVGDDRKVYQCVGAAARNKATSGVSHIIESMSSASDCIASSFVYEGQDFVLFKFPTANTTLLYSETLDYWVELSAGTNLTREQWYGNSVTKAYNKLLVTDYRNGNTYELDPDTYTDNGDTRLRIRVLPTFSGRNLNTPDRRVTATRLRINMQVGVGLATGQGSNPVVMCQFSPEGGEIWQAEQQVSIGVMGNYIQSVDFWDFATGYEIKARIMCSDPVYLSMFDGQIDLVDAGY